MRILIAGGGGTVGQALTRRATKQKHEVVHWNRRAVPYGYTSAMRQLLNETMPAAVVNLAIASGANGFNQFLNPSQTRFNLTEGMF